MDEDHKLMRRIACSEAGAFHALVDKHGLRSLRFMERITGSKEQAEDIVQEAFEAVWKQAPDWQPKAKFTTWFYRVLMNISQRRFRDRLRLYENLDETQADENIGAEALMLQHEISGMVEVALQALPERQRIAITLFYYEELSQKQACEVMKISEGAFESLLSRGRASLKAKLGSVHLH